VEYPVHGDGKSNWLRALPDWIEQDDVPKVNGEIVSQMTESDLFNVFDLVPFTP
jgi:hypothetical protein